MKIPEKRRSLYYVPLLTTEDTIELSNLRITPFLENREYSHLLPKAVFEGNGSLIEVRGFQSGDFYSMEVHEKTFTALEQLKFAYFFREPSYKMSFPGYVSSETFEYFTILEPTPDPSFEHKVYLSNGMHSVMQSLKTYHESRQSLKQNQLLASKESFSYLDYLSQDITDGRHSNAMRLYNRCWSTYSPHNSIDKPVLARASIELLAESKNLKLNCFANEFIKRAYEKLIELSNTDATVAYLTNLTILNRETLEKTVNTHIQSLTNARHDFAHSGIENQKLKNIPFYLLCFPLFWLVFLRYEEITAKEGVRIALFFCLLNKAPEDWQHSNPGEIPQKNKRIAGTKHSFMHTYAHYSRILPIWTQSKPEAADCVLKAIPNWFGLQNPS